MSTPTSQMRTAEHHFGVLLPWDERVVGILLGRGDVNPDQLDNYGQTPILCASENGRKRVVKLLLGRDDVDPNKPDMCGSTPLRLANLNHREGVIALLQPPTFATHSTA